MLRDMRRWIRHTLERNLGIAVFRKLPPGILLSRDLGRFGFRPAIVFDVGANIGHRTVEFALAWPEAQVFAFEPVQATCNTLRTAVRHYSNVRCFQLALGNQPGIATINLSPKSVLNSLTDINPPDATLGTEQIKVTTLDEFCAEAAVQQVDFIKVDTEGYDLKVLQGGRDLLARGAIAYIMVEAALGPSTERQVGIAEFDSFLGTYGYDLAGIYDQVVYGSGRLGFVNALYRRMID